MKLWASSAARVFLGPVFLGLFLLQVHIANAADLSEEHTGTGDLGVTLDYHLATEDSGIPYTRRSRPNPLAIFTTHLEFRDTVDSITNEQLVQLALNAYQEMKENAQSYQFVEDNDAHIYERPGVMTALAFGREVILASSQKGSRSFTYDYGRNRVEQDLRACIATEKHRTQGKCGEQIAAHLYYKLHPEGALQDAGARAVTVSEPNGKPVTVINPCGTKNSPGCKSFLAHINVRFLNQNTQGRPYDLDTLAGGLVQKRQPSLCANYP